MSDSYMVLGPERTHHVSSDSCYQVQGIDIHDLYEPSGNMYYGSTIKYTIAGGAPTFALYNDVYNSGWGLDYVKDPTGYTFTSDSGKVDIWNEYGAFAPIRTTVQIDKETAEVNDRLVRITPPRLTLKPYRSKYSLGGLKYYLIRFTKNDTSDNTATLRVYNAKFTSDDPYNATTHTIKESDLELLYTNTKMPLYMLMRLTSPGGSGIYYDDDLFVEDYFFGSSSSSGYGQWVSCSGCSGATFISLMKAQSDSERCLLISLASTQNSFSPGLNYVIRGKGCKIYVLDDFTFPITVRIYESSPESAMSWSYHVLGGLSGPLDFASTVLSTTGTPASVEIVRSHPEILRPVATTTLYKPGSETYTNLVAQGGYVEAIPGLLGGMGGYGVSYSDAVDDYNTTAESYRRVGRYTTPQTVYVSSGSRAASNSLNQEQTFSSEYVYYSYIMGNDHTFWLAFPQGAHSFIGQGAYLPGYDNSLVTLSPSSSSSEYYRNFCAGPGGGGMSVCGNMSILQNLTTDQKEELTWGGDSQLDLFW